MSMGEMFGQLGSTIGGFMFIWAIVQQYIPHNLRNYTDKYFQKLVNLFYSYIQITFNEFGEHLMRSEAHSAIETYLGANSSKQAQRFKGEINRSSKALSLSMDDNEEVTDVYEGVKVWWTSGKTVSKRETSSSYQATEEKRHYKLIFHKRDREFIIGPYLKHVIQEGTEINVRNRERKLYTNNGSRWSHVVFQHPATFQTLAMDPGRKQEIIDDLITFSKGEDYYARIGKAWKRGYLLYGPPGTGKSTMIAAMANLLCYDLFDLELTAVRDNTELRKLLIETSSKSIILIEDIDCSVDLTGQRKIKEEEEEEDKGSMMKKRGKEESESKASKVTLSGLLNFIDGLWSASKGERLIVFTTNHVEKLDPALIRRGRMDKHIELSYCTFEAFKVLAKNYLHLESHDHLFEKIRLLLDETKMIPADVAENLMPKTATGDAETSLKNLIGALEMAKQEAKLKSMKKESADANEEDKPFSNGESGMKKRSSKVEDEEWSSGDFIIRPTSLQHSKSNDMHK